MVASSKQSSEGKGPCSALYSFQLGDTGTRISVYDWIEGTDLLALCCDFGPTPVGSTIHQVSATQEMSLSDLTELHSAKDRQVTLSLVRQLAETVAFLHKTAVLHEDLQARNVRLSQDRQRLYLLGRSPAYSFADFGKSKREHEVV